MDRVVEVKLQMALVLFFGVVRGTVQCSSSLVIFLKPSPELSVGDVGEAAVGEVILTPGLSVGGVGGSVCVAAPTGRSLAMSPELSVRDVGTTAVGKTHSGIIHRGSGKP